MGTKLLESGGFEKAASAHGMDLYASGSNFVVTIGNIHIHSEELDSKIEGALGISPDRFVFMSTHRSKTNTPAITFHPIGNYSEALLGGRPRTLAPSCPGLMTGLMLAMAGKKHDGYQVTYEATHHGPFMDRPSMFAEIGSDEQAWTDEEAGLAMSRVLLSTADAEGINAVGVGGGHYCARFKEIAQKRKVNFGHFIPNHALQFVDEGMAQEIAEKSPGTAHFAIHEDKKHREEIDRVASALEAAGLKRLDHSAAEFR